MSELSEPTIAIQILGYCLLAGVSVVARCPLVRKLCNLIPPGILSACSYVNAITSVATGIMSTYSH